MLIDQCAWALIHHNNRSVAARLSAASGKRNTLIITDPSLEVWRQLAGKSTCEWVWWFSHCSGLTWIRFRVSTLHCRGVTKQHCTISSEAIWKHIRLWGRAHSPLIGTPSAIALNPTIHFNLNPSTSSGSAQAPILHSQAPRGWTPWPVGAPKPTRRRPWACASAMAWPNLFPVHS